MNELIADSSLPVLTGYQGMWCGNCQQDVPAVARAAGDKALCARCQQPFASQQVKQRVDKGGPRIEVIHPAAAEDNAADEPVVVEPWKASDLIGDVDDERLRAIGQALRASKTAVTAAKPNQRILRTDAAQPHGPRPAARPKVDSLAQARPPRAPSAPSQATAWVAALIGALLLGAGIGMIGWSLFGERTDLWNPGIAATLGGQGLMIIGLVQLLANLWTAGRDATNRLVSLHYEMRRLQRTADSLAGLRTATPSAFYADLARGSSPQVLMANLKGQLEEASARYAAE